MIVDDLTFFAIKECLGVIAEISAYFMFPTLAVGLLVAVFQAATQINEQSLSFIPKLMLLFIILTTLGTLLFEKLTTFTTQIINSIPSLI